MPASPRTRNLSAIKKKVREWARIRGFPVSLVQISKDRKTAYLRCQKHGDKTRTVGKVWDRGQLCDECARESRAGKGSARYIPFEEKKRRFADKHPQSKLQLTRELPRSRIVVMCGECNKPTTMAWGNMICNGPKTCKKCAARRQGTRQLLDDDEIHERFAELGLALTEPYRGSHYHHSIMCLRCNDTKPLKPNAVWGKRGMSCRCTKSTPLFCLDIIANAIGRHDPALKTEFRYANALKARKLDIWCPSFNRGFEVKYGISAFGRNSPRKNAAFRRYKHVLDQSRDYVRSGLDVSYIVIAPSGKFWAPKYILDNFIVYDLSTLRSIRHKKRQMLSDADIQTLTELFYRPSTIRGLEPLDTTERQNIRQSLKEYLVSHDNVFPTQLQIRECFGFTIKKFLAALGLDHSAGRDALVEACESFLGITPVFARTYHCHSISAKDQDIRERLLTWLKQRRRLPTRPEESQFFGRSRTGLQVLLGIKADGKVKLSSTEFCERINELPEMQGFPIYDLPPTADDLTCSDKSAIAAILAERVRTGVCPGCRQHVSRTSGAVCEKCYQNALRYVPDETNPLKRALVFIQQGLSGDVAEVGSDEWRRRLSVSQRMHLPRSLRLLVEEIERSGCVVCGERCIAASGLCSAHQQAVKKYWLDGQGNTAQARLHYLTEIRRRLRAVSLTKFLSVKKLSELLDPLFCAHDFRWMNHARDYLKYLITHRCHPRQTSRETGLTLAVWRDRALTYSKGTAVDEIRKNVLRLLTACKPAENP